MKKSIQFFVPIFFAAFMLTTFTDIQASTSNPLLTEYLQQSQEVNETTVVAETPETIIIIENTYNYACSPKLEESTVYDFIDD